MSIQANIITKTKKNQNLLWLTNTYNKNRVEIINLKGNHTINNSITSTNLNIVTIQITRAIVGGVDIMDRAKEDTITIEDSGVDEDMVITLEVFLLFIKITMSKVTLLLLIIIKAKCALQSLFIKRNNLNMKIYRKKFTRIDKVGKINTMNQRVEKINVGKGGKCIIIAIIIKDQNHVHNQVIRHQLQTV